MTQKIGKKLLAKLFEHIDLLAAGLALLEEQDFPLQETDLFLKKCIHLHEAVGLEGPALFYAKPTGKKSRLENSAAIVKENRQEISNWLSSLKYRLSLASEITTRQYSRLKKKLEVGIPNLFRLEIGD